MGQQNGAADSGSSLSVVLAPLAPCSGLMRRARD